MNKSDFLAKVAEIAAESPTYKLGEDGSNGQCDCVGLIIGAIRRCGVKYTEIHGSNWFARHYTRALMTVTAADDLQLGDLVYKARTPGAEGYALPSRYSKDPDRYDYYHIGVVTGVDPLRITHCTSGGGVDGIAVDSKLGQWRYKGQLTLIDDLKKEETPVSKGIVTAANGKPVNLRAKPKASAALIDRVPVGAEVTVRSSDGEWAQVSYNGRTGYMMAQFLTITGAADEAVSGDLAQRVAELTAAVAELQRRVTELEGGGAVG